MPSSLQLQQAMYQIPTQNQYAANVQGQQAPIVQQPLVPVNFQRGTQAVSSDEGGFSLTKFVGFGLAAVGLVGAIKTHQFGKEFEALKAAEGSTIAKGAEYKFGANFWHNTNPLNWFKNGETLKTVTTAEGSGFTKLGKSEKFIQAANGDVLQVSGAGVRKLDGGASEEANKFLTQTKPTTPEAPPVSSSETTKQTTTDVSKNIITKKQNQPLIKLTKEESELIKQRKQIESEISKIKSQMKGTFENYEQYSQLEETLKSKQALLKTDKMKEVFSKYKALKNQRAEIKANPSLSFAERISQKRADVKKIHEEKNLNPEIMKQNVENATNEIKNKIFGGNEIIKAEPKKKTFRSQANAVAEANQKNQAKITKLEEMMNLAQADYAKITNTASPEALALQDKMFTINEVIEFLKK